MKIKKYLLLITFLAFFSCNDKKIEEIKPIIKNSIEPSILPIITNTPAPTPIPLPTSTGKCLSLSEYNLEKKIHYPLDVVPAKDGSFVYVTTSEYNFRNERKLKNYDEKEIGNIKYYNSYPIEQIYKVYNDGFIEIMRKPDNYDDFYCEQKTIEKRNDNSLIIQGLKLLSFKDNNYSMLIENTIKHPIDNNCIYGLAVNVCNRELYKIANIFIENNNFFLIYYFYFNNSEGYKRNKEFIELFNIENKTSTKIYDNFDGIYDSDTKYSDNKFIGFPILDNLFGIVENKKYYFTSNSNSIYEDKVFFDIRNIIKDKEEIKKVGKIVRIRKDSKGNIFAFDSYKDIIWKIYPKEQKIELLAGSGISGYKDGKGKEASFNGISEIDIDSNDNLYVSDFYNHAIRKITPEGNVSTFYKEKD